MKSNFKKQTWSINTKGTPTIIKNCSKCGKQCEFINSGNFRVNANHKMLDVWLIYQCKKCNTTWNMEILSRTNAKSIDETSYKMFLENNKDLAEKYAFDINTLSKNKAVVDFSSVSYQIQEDITNSILAEEGLEVTIQCKFQIDVRLDKIISEKLNISREEVKKMCQNGLILSDSNNNIGKVKVKDGITFQILGNAIADKIDNSSQLEEYNTLAVNH
ncbi:MAG: hypothetical protein K0S41_3643 [Anaerocolumna sp.]|jgi:hypothetical protein|nr:hypothetical protein [Anaerocolumna sp.]